MRVLYPTNSLEKLCGLFGLTRQAYYQHKKRSIEHALEQELVIKQVLKIRKDHQRMGGRKLFFKLSSFLQEHEIKMGRDVFFRTLASHNLLVKKRKRKVYTTNSFHWLRRYPNLIKNFQPNAPNQLWVSDITYWKCGSFFLYISLITDAYSHMIVGCHISKTLESIESVQALHMAISKLRSIPDHLIHHSDRGAQYCSTIYVELLRGNNIQVSMTENGDPLENAIAERVNGILKDEYLWNQTANSFEEAKLILDRSIELYNFDRPHMSISNLTPYEVHNQNRNIEPQRLWKNYYQGKIAKSDMSFSKA